MKNLLLTLLLLTSLCACVRAQIQATTNDGKAVTLQDDGTWSYNEVAAPTPAGDCSDYVERRVWTSDGYVQVDFTEEHGTDLLMSLKCLQEL